MRFFLRLGRTVALIIVAVFLSIVAWSSLWPIAQVPSQKADAIICLSAGVIKTTGEPDLESTQRTRTCVDMFNAGIAPIVVFSGGVWKEKSIGQAMAEYARSLGLPEPAILIEPQAESTLQNALYSLPMIPDAKRLVLVTDAYHLPRSWLSFAFFGFYDNALVASSNLPNKIANDEPYLRRMVREALAFGLNSVRAPAYAMAGILGVPDQRRKEWLH